MHARFPGRDHAIGLAMVVALGLLGATLARPGLAQPAGEALHAIVGVHAEVPRDARTAASLGSRRAGTGVVIDDGGLIVTIGYLVLEASEVELRAADGASVPAEVVAYDHESGFGLLRAAAPLDAAPADLGNSDVLSPLQPLLAVSAAGDLDATGVFVVDRREFAGYWEYLLDEAIFTSPPVQEFGGAALLDREGRLVGIGSLLVNDAGRRAGRTVPGNMFVPINALKPILGDLLAEGRRADPPRPWLGASFEEHRGRVFVTRVSPEAPAAEAGIAVDDLILGVAGEPVSGLADFYRRLWAEGEAGVEVPLDVLKAIEVERVPVRTGDRYRYLRLEPTF